MSRKFNPAVDGWKYKACECGTRIFKKSRACSACLRHEAYANVRGGPGHGRRVVYSGGTMTCKMPRCHKTFQLRPHQDRRYTVYCPSCREKIAEITTGVLWLSSLGIEIGVDADGEEIIMDSVAKAYDIDSPMEEKI